MAGKKTAAPGEADHIVRVRVDSLIPYARNARTHSDEQVAKIAASIREFGFNNPILLRDDNTIIAGHGRVLAARKLGIEEVPCIYLSHLTETQARAYTLADNQLANLAGWDSELLSLELEELGAAGVDPGLLGFAPGDLPKGPLGDGEGAEPEINYKEHYAVLVECENESHQSEVYDALLEQGYTVKVLVN